MTRKEYIDYCKKCEFKSFDRDKGITCSITNEIANFDDNCSDFKTDKNYIEIEKEPNNNKTILFSILAAIIIGIVVLINVLKNDQVPETKEKEISFYEIFTEDDCLNFASEMETSLLKGDPLFLNRSIDYNYLVDYIVFQRKMSVHSKRNFKNIRVVVKQGLKT